MSLKAIETRYKGYNFRSRLEARWAVFFDALDIEWQYEPEGFELPDGTRYLPDFHLPKTNTWIEVKGSEVKDAEIAKACSLSRGLLKGERHALLAALLGLRLFSGVTAELDAMEPGRPSENRAALAYYLHSTPKVIIVEGIGVPGIGSNGQTIKAWVAFPDAVAEVEDPFSLIHFAFLPLDKMRLLLEEEAKNPSAWLNLVVMASNAARSARFEHGHSGSTQ